MKYKVNKKLRYQKPKALLRITWKKKKESHEKLYWGKQIHLSDCLNKKYQEKIALGISICTLLMSCGQ